MQAFRTAFSILIFSFFVSVCFSQQKWPNTFLWRITGNGLVRPSYLYGTIHLQDKRLFQFSDSLYHSLENAEGFALEIDFSELMDSIFSRSFQNAEDEFLQKEKVKVDRKKIDKSSDSLLRSLNLKYDKLTKKDLKKIRDIRMNRLIQQGEMQTIVDGYLYGVALRSGKWMGGIEDVVDQLDALDELGAELTPEETFQSEANLRLGLKQMIDIYINHDLQSMADYVDGRYKGQMKDIVLIKRNIKMARRMDSLANLRTMFFAVGAAHLAGDSGVINLLRSRGFTIEPIFSTQTIKPESYAAKLNIIPWKKIEDEIYSIEMPGAASDFNLMGEAVKMKVFFDLPTMTFYLSGHTIATSTSSENIDNAFKQIAERMGGSSGKIKSKDISSGDIKGREGRIDVPDVSFKLRLLQKKNIIYLLMAGSTKESNLDNSDIDKFFSSFSLKNIPVTSKKWTTFSVPGKGITLQMPGTPKPNKAIDRKAEGTGWNFTTYDMADNEKGLYYLLQVRDIAPGFYLEGDSTYFNIYKKNMSATFDKIISEEQFYYKGWPAFRIDFSFNSDGVYRIFNIQRGNRVYVFGGGGDKNADLSELDEAFNSITLEDYSQTEWKNYSLEGFSTKAPAIFKKVEKDSASQEQHFTSFDPDQALSYEIFKSPFPAYYWAKDDSSFFENKLAGYKKYNDSVIQHKFTHNGMLKGIDFVMQKPGNNTLRRIRLFVNGDTLYSLMIFIPKQYRDNENIEKFFNEFKVDKELPPTIYTSKAKELLEALKTNDSTKLAKAIEVFNIVSFAKTDLPLLHQALLDVYQKPEEYYLTINERIVNVMEDIADSSTVQFIASNYTKLDPAKEELKYNLLEVLANLKTGDSYSLLKRLILEHLPAKGNAQRLKYSLTDSLLLTKTLYPDILSLSKDSVFTELLVEVSESLLDSSMISMNSILPYRQNFLKQARSDLKLLKTDEDKWWSFRSWVNFIGRFNEKEGNALLYEFLKLKEVNAKYSAIVALVKNNQPVDSKEIETAASDKNYRRDLYDELRQRGKLKLFPIKFLTQQKIAESELFQTATQENDDSEPASITFLGEKMAVFMGERKKFYLFKVTYEGDGYSDSYLGVTGPYSNTEKEIISSSKAAGVLWDEVFDKKKIDEQLKAFISSKEEELKPSVTEPSLKK
jgi:uncharacterized protein YbaP (TraB family)